MEITLQELENTFTISFDRITVGLRDDVSEAFEPFEAEYVGISGSDVAGYPAFEMSFRKDRIIELEQAILKWSAAQPGVYAIDLLPSWDCPDPDDGRPHCADCPWFGFTDVGEPNQAKVCNRTGQELVWGGGPPVQIGPPKIPLERNKGPRAPEWCPLPGWSQGLSYG
jgi:hypothetical protein